jgi:hypothetical protein
MVVDGEDRLWVGTDEGLIQMYQIVKGFKPSIGTPMSIIRLFATKTHWAIVFGM